MSRRKGLRTISVTDHDAVDGVAEAIVAVEDGGLEIIPGVEISAHTGATEVHILGYFVDCACQEFVRALARFRQSRLERAREMVARLRAQGVFLSWERVFELAGEGAVGRPHIARVMQEARYVGTVQEAFERYLGRQQPAYVPRLKMMPEQAMHLIREAGGLPVLAHPRGVEFAIPDLVAGGLVGLEAHYMGYSSQKVAHLRDVAGHHDLVCTGGSDFHGLAILPENRLGGVYVPQECLAALRERRRLLYPRVD